MCGITGFSGPEDKNVLKGMNEVIVHRGPDEDGFYSDGSMNLAMRRLSIVDVSTGTQPISNEDGSVWVVFNGEIYDHTELRHKMEEAGHRFKTDHSDTEVIVHLYEEYGEDWANRVNGMFAVALWDARKKQLSLYRDRIGKKPLYYSLKSKRVVFGSEIKSVLKHPEVSREMDYRSLYAYFGLKNTSAPATAYKDVKQLLPGHVLTWKAGDVRTFPYWELDFGSVKEDVSEEEAVERLLWLLEDAVKIRMRCDVPYGAYLSGGVDSSSVVVLMSRNQTKPVKTFSLGYEDRAVGQFAGKNDDIGFARDMAKRLGTEHYEYIINAEQFAGRMEDVLSAFDEPFSGTVSTFFLSILIRDHVKVALSGDGADELFASYLAHRLAFPIRNYMDLAGCGKAEWADLSLEEKGLLHPFDAPDKFDFLKKTASKSLSEWRSRLEVFPRQERNGILSKAFLDASGYPSVGDVYAELEKGLTARDALNRSLEMDQKELLPNQVLPFVDRLSMAHSIEVRSPYLDYRIIEFANSLPGSLKIRNGTNKYIHKKAMERILPKAIIERSKEGFVQPIYSWMHGSLKAWTCGQLDLLPGELFNMDRVTELKKRFENGDTDVNARIWNLVCFGLWFRSIK